MPFHKTIKQKKVILKAGNRLILQKLDQALTRHLPPDHTESSQSELAPGEAKARPGLKNMIIASLSILLRRDIDPSTNFCILKQLDFNIDPAADDLRLKLISQLNGLLKHVHKTWEDSEKEEIESRFILVREILLRLISIALSADLNPQRDGDIIVKILEDFCKIVIQDSKILEDTGLLKLKRNARQFQIELMTQHAEWINLIKNIIKINKILRAPSNIFTQALNDLQEIKNVIQRQLCVRLDSEIDSKALAPDWLNPTNGTLRGCEDKFIGKHYKKVVSVYNEVDDTVRQAMIIVKIKPADKNQFQRLYDALNRTNELLRAIKCLDEIITASGWVFFITGTINIQILINQIKIHSDTCKAVVNIRSNDPILKTKALKGLTEYSAYSLKPLKCLTNDSYLRLHALIDKNVIGYLWKILNQKANELIGLQTQYNLAGLVNLRLLQSSPDPESEPTSHSRLLEYKSDSTDLSLHTVHVEDGEVVREKIAAYIMQDSFHIPREEQAQGMYGIILKKLKSYELERTCATPTPQYRLSTTLNSYLYHGFCCFYGPVKEKGVCNKIAGFFKTFDCFNQRSAFSSPEFEDRAPEQLAETLEQLVDASYNKACH